MADLHESTDLFANPRRLAFQLDKAGFFCVDYVSLDEYKLQKYKDTSFIQTLVVSLSEDLGHGTGKDCIDLYSEYVTCACVCVCVRACLCACACACVCVCVCVF